MDSNKRILIPKGCLSKDKSITMILPNTSAEFDEEFKKTDIGKAFMWLTELKNLEKTQVDIINEGSIRKTELLKRIGDGEVSKAFMGITDELVKDSLRRNISKDDKSNSFTGVPQRG